MTTQATPAKPQRWGHAEVLARPRPAGSSLKPPHGRSHKGLCVLALVCLAVALPSAGDWLVTRSGQRIETKGAWTVKDCRVLFYTTGGTLTALPLASIDAEASRAASSGAPPLLAPPARRPAATVRLTDQDVGHVDPSGFQAPLPGEPPPAPGEASRQHKVVIYSATWCGYCTAAKAYLTKHGITFTERDVDKDPTARAELAAKLPGYRGVPVIDIDGKLLRGFSPLSLGQALGIPPEAPAKPSSLSPGRG